MTADDAGDGDEETNDGEDDEGSKTTTGDFCAAGPAGAGDVAGVKINGFGCRHVAFRHLANVAFVWSLPHIGHHQATGALLSDDVLVEGFKL